MAGTDANIYIMLFGEHGPSKKIHLVDNTKDKQLFEKNSVDKFRFRMHSLGNLSKLRIEHDGKGMGAGWFLEKIIIRDSTRPKDTFYFIYHGWIAKDEGEGKLWREIRAKKVLPKEMQHGEKTRYNISVKTSDIRYAGTDANVFIQIAGVEGGITPKLKLDDAKNNFERNMVDNFELDAVNVGVIDHVVIGHDSFGPGAGWHLEKVTIRRYIPKSEARERVKKAKKRLKKQKKVLTDRFGNKLDSGDDDDDDDDRKQKKKQKNKSNIRSKENDENFGRRRPSSAMSKRERFASRDSGRFGGAGVPDSDDEYRHMRERIRYGEKNMSDSDGDYDTGRNRSQNRSPGRGKKNKQTSEDELTSKQLDDLYTVSSEGSEDESSLTPRGRRDSKARPGSALRRQSESISERRNSKLDKSDNNRRSSSASSFRRSSSALNQSLSERRTSTSASSIRRREAEENKKNKKGKKRESDDDVDDTNLDEARLPLYEEYLFMCNRWLAKDEDDGLCKRELPVTSKTVYYRD